MSLDPKLTDNELAASLIGTIFAEPGEGGIKRCEQVHLSLIIGGKILTPKGRAVRDRHIETCGSCGRPGAFDGDLYACIELTEEIKRELENVFGPTDWTGC